MKLTALINFLEEHAPLQYQEAYDNAGLIVGNPDMEISGVLVALDAIEAVVDEAIELGVNVIVAHHPIIFGGLKQLTGANYIQRTVIKAIKNDIAIYAIHTNLDNLSVNGVNNKICAQLGLEDTRILLPKPEYQQAGQSIGAGMIGKLAEPMDEMAFFSHLKTSMELKVFKYTALRGMDIQHVAVCGGSGRFLLEEAIAQKADIFISSDFKYHEFFDANDQIIIADIGHYESEQFTTQLLVELISEKFSNFAAHYTKVLTNPINYF